MRLSVDDVDVQIGGVLRTLRRRRGLSQTALAGHIGVSYQQLQKYELGTNRIAPSRLAMAAKALGVEPGEFFADLDEQTEVDPAVVFARSAEGVELNRAFFRIRDARLRARIVELVDAISNQLGR